MKLKAARILGYQSFQDSGEMHFKAGINLIVGQNNSGKSAILRAIRPGLSDDRHRSPERWEQFRLPPPEVRLQLELSGEEFSDAILQINQSALPTPPSADATSYVQHLLREDSLTIDIIHKPGRTFETLYPGHKLFKWDGTSTKVAALIHSIDGQMTIERTFTDADSTGQLAAINWQNNMFYFASERMNVGQYTAEPAVRLLENAQNLPSVLLTLQGDRGDLFQKLVSHLRDIFPTVGNLSIRPIGSNQVEIRVWPTEKMERVELSFPLLHSGTGLSQVIAILTTVITSKQAVIVIDEINSFLHPAAVKSLLRILRSEYPENQYIISTHAPEVIGFSNPESIFLVKRDGYTSEVKTLDIANLDSFREIASTLGMSMADVFAADRIVWVEGATEELCFPFLYRLAKDQPLPPGTIFTAVIATGDFVSKKRDKELIYRIYQRISQTSAPLVTKVAFSFDSENLTQYEKDDMKRQSANTINFLPRRHIECYLINPDAITSFINEKMGGQGKVEAKTVTQYAEDLANKYTYNITRNEECSYLNDINWMSRVDAANFIRDVCETVSGQRVTFKKKDDTLRLLQIVESINPHQITELKSYVASLVESVNLP